LPILLEPGLRRNVEPGPTDISTNRLKSWRRSILGIIECLNLKFDMVLSEVFTHVIAHSIERWVSHGLKLPVFGEVKRRGIQESGA
jgi:hypothetical protein